MSMLPVASFATKPEITPSGKAYAMYARKGGAGRKFWIPLSQSKFEDGILYVADWLMAPNKDIPLLISAGFQIDGALPLPTMPLPAATAPAEIVPLPPQPAAFEAIIQKGFFTVEGDGERHMTFRIKTSPRTGKTVIGLLQGRNNMSDYAWFAYIEGAQLRYFRNPQMNGNVVALRVDRATIENAWQVIKGDPTAAGKRFARESRQCMRCGKELTTPESLNIGLGPVCDGRERPFHVGKR
jgi:hypothetical protein